MTPPGVRPPEPGGRTPEILRGGRLARRAVAVVAARAAGQAMDPTWRVTINFHPDHPFRAGTVLDGLAATGVYRSQFVTRIGNGGLGAHPGGDRWHWESALFGGVYDEAPGESRPVYGALDPHAAPYGAAIRFGSAYLRLNAATLTRTTFCYPDSHLRPSAVGTADRMALPALLHASDPADPLDHYIEAHIHGPLRLDRDVDALVLDPAHRATAVAETAARLPCPVHWHPGFRLTVDELAHVDDYRGPDVTALGRRLAVDGALTPRELGAAARSGAHDTRASKKLWHCLARFGRHTAEK